MVSSFHFHFLFRGSVSMSENSNYRSKFPMGRALADLFGSEGSGLVLLFQKVLVDWIIVHQLGQVVERPFQLLVDYPPDLIGAVDVVLLGRLDKTEPVHITDVRFVSRSQKVKATNALFKGVLDLPCDFLLLLG